MDYTKTDLTFRLKKALRYVRLYGPSRTISKVRGQYHMNKRYETLPPSDPDARGGHVGLIGCGNFAFSNIAYYLHKNNRGAMRAAMDVDLHRAASLAERYGLRYYTDQASAILEDPEIDLVYIASNHASHAEYAIDALRRGKSVHIEKPHVVTDDQLVRLCDAMDASGGKVGLGFNRPHGRMGKAIKEHMASQSGPSMMNWFVAGHEISPDHWYFQDEEGGRILGNLCHWTDFVLQLVALEDRYPLRIAPTRAEKSDCDIAVTYTFGDASIAAITFSAKGHTFEGVRERFAAHRGDVLIALDDFKTLVVEIVDRKITYRPLYRDHGHEVSVMSSYELVRPRDGADGTLDVGYVWETGNLFLRTKEALDRNEPITIASAAR